MSIEWENVNIDEVLERILSRKREIQMESYLSSAKVASITKPFDDLHQEILSKVANCKVLENEWKYMNSLESQSQVYEEMNNLIELNDISLPAKQKEKEVSISLPAESLKNDPVENNLNNHATELAKSTSLVILVTPNEFESIPKYMRGRMSLHELNEIVGKLDEFLQEKRRLMRAPYKKLTIKDKDLVCKWKEQETPATKQNLFCREEDVKQLLSEKLKVQLKTALPCLRHVKKITQLRDKGQQYIFPS